jgi:hypothetical protein
VNTNSALSKAILELHRKVRDEAIARLCEDKSRSQDADAESVWNIATGIVLTEVFMNVYAAMSVSDGSVTLRELVDAAMKTAEEEWTKLEKANKS